MGIEKPIGWDETKIRNQREKAPEIRIPLFGRDNEEIHRDLRQHFPRVVDLWWELDEGDATGWVYDHVKVLGKLVHEGIEHDEDPRIVGYPRG